MMNSEQKRKMTPEQRKARIEQFNDEPSRTQQQFAKQCDVNEIMKKYLATGEIHHQNRTSGVYADVSEITDYASSMQKILNAQKAFAGLPAKLRDRFHNDPEQLLAFMQDHKNYDEGVQLGLYEPNQKPSELNQLTQTLQTLNQTLNPNENQNTNQKPNSKNTNSKTKNNTEEKP